MTQTMENRSLFTMARLNCLFLTCAIMSSLQLSCVHSFVQPRTFVNSNSRSLSIDIHSEPLQMFHNDLSAATSIIISDDAAAIASANSALEGVRTFFVVIAAIVFGFAGLTFVTAAFIVPQAAQQLETDTKRLRPGLWEEFEAKLEEGETMAIRPDLLQDLGKIMQPIIIQDFEDSANSKGGDGSGSGAGGSGKSTTTSSSGSSMVDNDQWTD